MNRRGVLARLGLSAGAGLCGLAGGEGLARWLAPASVPLRLDQLSDVVEAREGIRIDDLFEPNPELFWRLRPDVVLDDAADGAFLGRIANAQHLRQAEIVPRRPTRNRPRLLFVGDSCTFGYGVRIEQTVPAQLQALLRSGPQPVECINAGVPGYTLFQGWSWLVHYGFGLQPDLVLLQFGWNERAGWDGQGDLDHFRAARRAAPPPVLRWSRLAGLAAAVTAPADPQVAGVRNRPRLLPWEFRVLLDDIAERAQSVGSEVLAIAGATRSNLTEWSHYHTPYQAEMLRRTTLSPLRGGIAAAFDEVTSLQQAAREQGGDGWFLDGVHKTARANHRLAQALAAHLDPWLEAWSR